MAKDDHKFEHCFRDREHNHAICGFPAGMSPSQQKTLLKKHPSWYRSIVEYDENGFLKTDGRAVLTTGSHQNL